MFKFTIETRNAAFEDMGNEIARILRKLADKVEESELNEFDAKFSLMDYNGNKVGTAVFVPEVVQEDDDEVGVALKP
jgi:hypothetical protein